MRAFVSYQHNNKLLVFFFFFSSRRRHTRLQGDWSSDVCSSDLTEPSIKPASPGCTTCSRNKRFARAVSSSLRDRKSTRLNSSHLVISYAVFCLTKNRRRSRRGGLVHDGLDQRRPADRPAPMCRR